MITSLSSTSDCNLMISKISQCASFMITGIYGDIVSTVIVHSTKLLNFDWSRAVQLIPNCTP